MQPNFDDPVNSLYLVFQVKLILKYRLVYCLPVCGTVYYCIWSVCGQYIIVYGQYIIVCGQYIIVSVYYCRSVYYIWSVYLVSISIPSMNFCTQ